MNTSARPERSAGVDDGAFRLRPLRGLRSTRTETVRRGVEGRGGNASWASSKRSPFQGFLTDRYSRIPRYNRDVESLILIADDDRPNLESLSRIFAKEG